MRPALAERPPRAATTHAQAGATLRLQWALAWGAGAARRRPLAGAPRAAAAGEPEDGAPQGGGRGRRRSSSGSSSGSPARDGGGGGASRPPQQPQGGRKQQGGGWQGAAETRHAGRGRGGGRGSHSGRGRRPPAAGRPPDGEQKPGRGRQRVQLFQGTSQQPGQEGGAGPPPGSAAAARALTARIMAAGHWQALSALLAESGGDLNPIHCAALVHRASRLCQGGLAKVSPASERTRLASILNSVLQVSAYSLEDHRPQELATVLGGLARLGYLHNEYVMASEEASLSLLPACKAQELAVLGWAYGRLGYVPSEDWLAGYARETSSRMADLNTTELSNVLWAFARWARRPPDAWMAAFWSALQAQLLDAKPACIVSVLWSTAMMGTRPPGELLDGLLLEAQVKFPSFSAHGLATLAWAVARMDLRPRKMWLDDYVRHTQRAIPSFSNDQVFTNVAWALANWEHRPPDAWLQELCRAAVPFLPAMGPGGLSILATSLAALAAAPPWPWASYLLEEFHRGRGRALAPQVAALLWALPRLLRPAAAEPGWAVPARWTRQHAAVLLDLTDQVGPALAELPPADLTDLVVGVADLGLFPGEGWMDAHEGALNARLAELSEEQFGAVKAAYARLDVLCAGDKAAALRRQGRRAATADGIRPGEADRLLKQML